jgi:hypothetical protein
MGSQGSPDLCASALTTAPQRSYKLVAGVNSRRTQIATSQTNLPYNRYLTDNELYTDLKTVFQNREKPINTGSTQRNEIFNRTVTSKNLKSLFYSGS